MHDRELIPSVCDVLFLTEQRRNLILAQRKKVRSPNMTRVKQVRAQWLLTAIEKQRSVVAAEVLIGLKELSNHHGRFQTGDGSDQAFHGNIKADGTHHGSANIRAKLLLDRSGQAMVHSFDDNTAKLGNLAVVLNDASSNRRISETLNFGVSNDVPCLVRTGLPQSVNQPRCCLTPVGSIGWEERKRDRPVG